MGNYAERLLTVLHRLPQLLLNGSVCLTVQADGTEDSRR